MENKQIKISWIIWLIIGILLVGYIMIKTNDNLDPIIDHSEIPAKLDTTK